MKKQTVSKIMTCGLILLSAACAKKRGQGARGIGPSFGELSARGELTPAQARQVARTLEDSGPNLPKSDDWNGKHSDSPFESFQTSFELPHALAFLNNSQQFRSQSSFTEACEKTVEGTDADQDRDGIHDFRKRKIDCTEDKDGNVFTGAYVETDFDPRNSRSGGKVDLQGLSLKLKSPVSDGLGGELGLNAAGSASIRGVGKILTELQDVRIDGYEKSKKAHQNFNIKWHFDRKTELFDINDPDKGGIVHEFNAAADIRADKLNFDVGLVIEGRNLVYQKLECKNLYVKPTYVSGTITARDGAGHVLKIVFNGCNGSSITFDNQPVEEEPQPEEPQPTPPPNEQPAPEPQPEEPAPTEPAPEPQPEPQPEPAPQPAPAPEPQPEPTPENPEPAPEPTPS